MARNNQGETVTRKATKTEEAIAGDEAQARSLLTGEVLREKGLCPLVITRSRDAGVHIGWLARYERGDVELLEARRLWRWSGGRNTLNEIARSGIEQGRISQAVPQLALLDVCEVLPVSESATPSLTKERWD